MSRIVRSVCPRGKRLGFFLLVSTLFGALPALAQDAVRPSLAGEAAAEARRQDIEHIPYNLLVGPVRFRFSATFGVEYNDNINLSDEGTGIIVTPTGPVLVKSDKQEDVILRPAVSLD